MRKASGWVSDEGEVQCFAGFASKRENGVWSGKGADVKAVCRGFAAFVGGFADDDAVVTVFRSDEGEVGIGFQERAVVAGSEFGVSRIKDGDVCIEENAPEPHGLGLDGESLAFFQRDDKYVHVLGGDDSLDGGVECYALGLRRVVVGFGCFDGWERADPEIPQVGNVVGGADADGMFAERRVGRDVESCGGELVVFCVYLEIGEGEAGLVGDEFLEGADVLIR